jgi:hypothetical protein
MGDGEAAIGDLPSGDEMDVRHSVPDSDNRHLSRDVVGPRRGVMGTRFKIPWRSSWRERLSVDAPCRRESDP